MARIVNPAELKALERFIEEFPHVGIIAYTSPYGISLFVPNHRIAIRFCITIDQIKEAIRSIQYILSCIEIILELGFSIEFCENESPEFFAKRRDISFYCSYMLCEKRLQMYSIIGKVKYHIDNTYEFPSILESQGIHAL